MSSFSLGGSFNAHGAVIPRLNDRAVLAAALPLSVLYWLIVVEFAPWAIPLMGGGRK